MNKQQLKAINNAIAQEDFTEFKRLVGKLTPNQVAESHKEFHKDFDYMLWTVCVTWGFEVTWAMLAKMTPQEIEALKAESPDMDTEVPDDLTPDIPLSQHAIWSPQDIAYSRLSS